MGKCLEKYVKDYVIFDLETTGLSADSDEVIEISAIKVKNGKVTDEFSVLVNPGMSIPYAASRVNGITDDMVRDAESFEKVLADFLSFVGDMVLVGHNIHSFDLNFIYRDAKRFYGKPVDNDYVDTLRLARRCLPQLSRHRLGDLADYYGISTEGAHRALNDCRMNQKIYEHLAGEIKAGKLGAVEERICGACGNPMVRRKGKYGEFWGCSAYPRCKNTEH